MCFLFSTFHFLEPVYAFYHPSLPLLLCPFSYLVIIMVNPLLLSVVLYYQSCFYFIITNSICVSCVSLLHLTAFPFVLVSLGLTHSHYASTSSSQTGYLCFSSSAYCFSLCSCAFELNTFALCFYFIITNRLLVFLFFSLLLFPFFLCL